MSGHKTFFRLSWDGDNPTLEQVADAMAQVEAVMVAEDAECACFGDSFDTEMQTISVATLVEEGLWGTWDHHVGFMAGLSRYWPDVVFLLEGEGEDSRSDVWRDYYLGGKQQTVFEEVIWPPFDPQKLEEVI